MKQLRHVLVTGASGVVGRMLVPALLSAGFRVRATARTRPAFEWARHPHPDCEFVELDLESGRLEALVDGVDAVAHLAARAHIMHETARDPLQINRQINTDVTLRLARTAADAGVAHFLFVSTIKVNGESTLQQPFTEKDAPDPQDAYASSKAEAEAGLEALALSTGMGCTILRPPLIYGPGVKGNLASLVKAITRGWPLPLGAIHNRRSLLYSGNLADAIRAALLHPPQGTRLYLVSDGQEISTPELIRAIGRALGMQPVLLSVPPTLLQLAGGLSGRTAAVRRLLGSLVIDSSRIRTELDWQPPYSLEQGLALSFRNCSGR